jgi:gamma-glutamylcyclotransferase (GGCT)/AIG2-like uncharacterized protein YtfP
MNRNLALWSGTIRATGCQDGTTRYTAAAERAYPQKTHAGAPVGTQVRMRLRPNPLDLAHSDMTNRLFVYGTLLSTAGHPMGARLQREARLMGPGTVRGRLYSLGRYPGLVETERAGSLAHGELYTLKMPAVALKWLDAYEGILPGRPEESPYERVIRRVRLETGQTVDAWVYLYRRSVRMRPEVKGGRWTTPQA